VFDGGSGFVNVTGGIANSLQTDFYQDGAANFVYVENALWAVGMDVTIVDDNTASTNRAITLVTADTPVAGVSRLTVDGAADMGNFTTAQNATITRRNILDFSSSIVAGVDAYKYYTGLLSRVQSTVDGLEEDISFPGIRAAGVQIEVVAPTVQKLQFEVDITLNEGISLSTVIDDVKNAVSSYINATKVGEDIVLSEVIKRVKSIAGIADVSITIPTDNIAIADGEVGRISDNNIVIG